MIQKHGKKDIGMTQKGMEQAKIMDTFETYQHFGRIDGCGHREGRRAMHVNFEGRGIDFERESLVALQHIELVDPWIIKHKDVIRKKYSDRGLQMTNRDLIKEHNSGFMTWFRDELRANPPRMMLPRRKRSYSPCHRAPRAT